MAARGFGEILNSGRSRFPELRCQKGSQKVFFPLNCFASSEQFASLLLNKTFIRFPTSKQRKAHFSRIFTFPWNIALQPKCDPELHDALESLITVNESRNMKGGEKNPVGRGSSHSRSLISIWASLPRNKSHKWRGQRSSQVSREKVLFNMTSFRHWGSFCSEWEWIYSMALSKVIQKSRRLFLFYIVEWGASYENRKGPCLWVWVGTATRNKAIGRERKNGAIFLREILDAAVLRVS